MPNTPFVGSGALRVVCQDNRLAQLCDTAIISALVTYNPLGNYASYDPRVLLAAIAVLKRLGRHMTIADVYHFLNNHETAIVGLNALLQDGVASFSAGLGNFNDFNSGFENGRYFISKQRYEDVWNYMAKHMPLPPLIYHAQTMDCNNFGEPGLWITPVYLALDNFTLLS